MAKKLSLKEATERACRFCAYRERSPNEVYEKVKSWGLPDSQSKELVSILIGLEFIDEQRFANAYCNDKFEFNSWGKQKIKAHIYTYQVPERVIVQALDNIDEEKYQRRLFRLAEKKWKTLLGDEPERQKQKTASYLLHKGFELDLVWKAIGLLEKGKDRR
ncbi:MAG: regulatory protein RecX [Bacteroidota bacterium]